MGWEASNSMVPPPVEVFLDAAPKKPYVATMNSTPLSSTLVPLVLTAIFRKCDVILVQATQTTLPEHVKLCEHSLVARVILAKG